MSKKKKLPYTPTPVSSSVSTTIVSEAVRMLEQSPSLTKQSSDNQHVLAHARLVSNYDSFSLVDGRRPHDTPLVTFHTNALNIHVKSAFAVVTFHGAQAVVTMDVCDVIKGKGALIDPKDLGEVPHWDEDLVKKLIAVQYSKLFPGVDSENVQVFPNHNEAKEYFSLAHQTKWDMAAIEAAIAPFGEFVKSDGDYAKEVDELRQEEDLGSFARMVLDHTGSKALDTITHHYPVRSDEYACVSTTIASRFNVVAYLGKEKSDLRSVFIYDTQSPFHSSLINLDLVNCANHRVIWSQFYLTMFHLLSRQPVNTYIDYIALQRMMFAPVPFHMYTNAIELTSLMTSPSSVSILERWMRASVMVDGFLVSMDVVHPIAEGRIGQRVEGWNPFGSPLDWRRVNTLQSFHEVSGMRACVRYSTLAEIAHPDQRDVHAHRARELLRDINHFWLVVLISMSHLLPKEVRDNIIQTTRNEMFAYKALVANKDRLGWEADPF